MKNITLPAAIVIASLILVIGHVASRLTGTSKETGPWHFHATIVQATGPYVSGKLGVLINEDTGEVKIIRND